MKKNNNAILLSTPYIIWMVAFTLIPLGVVAYYAFTDPNTGAFSMKNILELQNYLPVLWQSVLYSLISALICLVLGYPVAYFIARQGEVMQKILYMLVMLPMCMSFLLRTLAWVGLLQDTGIINDILEAVGIGRMQLIRTPGAVILGMVYNYLPYMILPLYAIIVKIDNRLIEAAEDLGCTPTQVFARVVLPLSMPGILSGFLMSLTYSIDDFVISYFTHGASAQTLSITIFSMTRRKVSPEVNALSAIIFVVVLTILLIVNIVFFKGCDFFRIK